MTGITGLLWSGCEAEARQECVEADVRVYSRSLHINYYDYCCNNHHYYYYYYYYFFFCYYHYYYHYYWGLGFRGRGALFLSI